MEKSVNENLENEYFKKLEEEHKKLFPPLSEREWLATFPEALGLYILPKIEELKITKRQLEKSIREAFERIKGKVDGWFLELVIMFFPGQDLLDIKSQLRRLQDLVVVPENRSDNRTKGVSEEEKNRALAKPIESVIGRHIKLKKVGDGFSGLCPFHRERTPSFRTYTKTNSYYCFGACGKGGNSINFVMEFLNLNFIEAVRFLNNNY
ncbi:MAG: hypothetical protein A2639_02240 [Candidatus Staskawiczbacteria bacterium RIFCSPHIGHO2_01_FULL_34_27]|nr:MAG: hypothetical protein A2639_02240 [Candidatus Staskawiczbacteria bacterium RIFCSPHIGHO2_01_FULL_34_27]